MEGDHYYGSRNPFGAAAILRVPVFRFGHPQSMGLGSWRLCSRQRILKWLQLLPDKGAGAGAFLVDQLLALVRYGGGNGVWRSSSADA